MSADIRAHARALERECDRLLGRIAELEADSAEAFAAWIAKSGGMIEREVSLGGIIPGKSLQSAHVAVEEFREARDDQRVSQ